MTVRKILANLTRHLLRAVGYRAVTKTIRGGPVRIPLAMGELRSLLFDPAYSPFFNEDDVMDALSERMRPEDIVYDIGAYCGVWAVLLARQVREVMAFEPNPGTFAVLRETIAVNRVPNITACDVALGGQSRVAELWGTGSGASLRPGEARPSSSRVRVETLDSFAAGMTAMPDVLKIDVEGAELDVLSGGPQCLAHARLVCIEVHFDELPKFGTDYAKIGTLMAQAGFIEVMRSHPERAGAEDATRMHVVFEKRSEARGAG
jgi:methyltransferase, FkbM family